ncbi:MAG: hypothetical protein ACRDNE_19150 [Gaiellaceae bacterium]
MLVHLTTGPEHPRPLSSKARGVDAGVREGVELAPPEKLVELAPPEKLVELAVWAETTLTY